MRLKRGILKCWGQHTGGQALNIKIYNLYKKCYLDMYNIAIQFQTKLLWIMIMH